MTAQRLGHRREFAVRRRRSVQLADVTANGNLNGPLGLATAPNGDLLSVNAGGGLIVETTPAGGGTKLVLEPPRQLPVVPRQRPDDLVR
jgi:hypothetical protein